MKSKKFYVVWRGRERGIYDDWDSCRSVVEGFHGALYKSFATKQEALKALEEGASLHLKKRGTSSSLGNSKIKGGRTPVKNALTVDAACSGNPGVMEYRAVWYESGEEYFRMGPYPEGTVNIGEFLAIVHALAQLKKDGLNVPVYTDSTTALKWLKDKKANTKLCKSFANTELFQLVARAEEWLKKNSFPNSVLKWDTKLWGEIPADYGRK